MAGYLTGLYPASWAILNTQFVFNNLHLNST